MKTIWRKFTTGWEGVILGGDELFDYSGTQEKESRAIVEAFSQLLQIPVGKDYDFSALTQECPECGQQTTRAKPTCLYCGASLLPID